MADFQKVFLNAGGVRLPSPRLSFRSKDRGIVAGWKSPGSLRTLETPHQPRAASFRSHTCYQVSFGPCGCISHFPRQQGPWGTVHRKGDVRDRGSRHISNLQTRAGRTLAPEASLFLGPSSAGTSPAPATMEGRLLSSKPAGLHVSHI